MTTAPTPLLALDVTRAPGLALDATRAATWTQQLLARVDAQEVGFLNLAQERAVADACVAFAAAAPEVDEVLIIGIGGSALPARVIDALRPRTGTWPRLTVFDTVDPHALDALLERLDPARTLVIGISKSGTTLETASVFPLVMRWMQGALGADAARHLVAITGRDGSALRAEAELGGFPCFDVPLNVGGRFSALTAVGLLPAALVGVSPHALLDGAAAARSVALTDDAIQNPALALALLHADAEAAGLHTTVVWPYGERLTALGPWAAQLISESTGKRRPDGESVGVAAMAARGPADQHSLLQLLLDGPQGRLVVFVEGVGAEPCASTRLAESDFAHLGEVLAACREATAQALSARERPSATIRLRGPDAEAIGAFWMVYETAVALWGLGRGIDPFDQPAVALGKRIATARLTGAPMPSDPQGEAERRVIAIP